MNKSYDLDRAERLIPLLSAISRELTERHHEIRVISGRLASLESQEISDEFLDLKAELATHRREVRMALKELERLGCVVDEANPSRIMIPGLGGTLDAGFQWEASDPTLRPISTETAA